MHMSNGKPELMSLLDVNMDQGTRPRGVSEPNVWLYSLSWITIQELGAYGGVQRDNPLCTPTQPLIVHLVLGWIHQHSFTFINTMFTIIPTHIKSILIINSKHAISCNSCRGLMISINSYVS